MLRSVPVITLHNILVNPSCTLNLWPDPSEKQSLVQPLKVPPTFSSLINMNMSNYILTDIAYIFHYFLKCSTIPLPGPCIKSSPKHAR